MRVTSSTHVYAVGANAGNPVHWLSPEQAPIRATLARNGEPDEGRLGPSRTRCRLRLFGCRASQRPMQGWSSRTRVGGEISSRNLNCTEPNLTSPHILSTWTIRTSSFIASLHPSVVGLIALLFFQLYNSIAGSAGSPQRDKIQGCTNTTSLLEFASWATADHSIAQGFRASVLASLRHPRW